MEPPTPDVRLAWLEAAVRGISHQLEALAGRLPTGCVPLLG